MAVGSRTYAAPITAQTVAGTFNACDVTDFQTIVPAETRHNVLASFDQEELTSASGRISTWATDNCSAAGG